MSKLAIAICVAFLAALCVCHACTACCNSMLSIKTDAEIKVPDLEVTVSNIEQHRDRQARRISFLKTYFGLEELHRKDDSGARIFRVKHKQANYVRMVAQPDGSLFVFPDLANLPTKHGTDGWYYVPDNASYVERETLAADNARGWLVHHGLIDHDEARALVGGELVTLTRYKPTACSAGQPAIETIRLYLRYFIQISATSPSTASSPITLLKQPVLAFGPHTVVTVDYAILPNGDRQIVGLRLTLLPYHRLGYKTFTFAGVDELNEAVQADLKKHVDTTFWQSSGVSSTVTILYEDHEETSGSPFQLLAGFQTLTRVIGVEDRGMTRDFMTLEKPDASEAGGFATVDLYKIGVFPWLGHERLPACQLSSNNPPKRRRPRLSVGVYTVDDPANATLWKRDHDDSLRGLATGSYLIKDGLRFPGICLGQDCRNEPWLWYSFLSPHADDAAGDALRLPSSAAAAGLGFDMSRSTRREFKPSQKDTHVDRVDLAIIHAHGGPLMVSTNAQEGYYDGGVVFLRDIGGLGYRIGGKTSYLAVNACSVIPSWGDPYGDDYRPTVNALAEWLPFFQGLRGAYSFRTPSMFGDNVIVDFCYHASLGVPNLEAWMAAVNGNPWGHGQSRDFGCTGDKPLEPPLAGNPPVSEFGSAVVLDGHVGDRLYDTGRSQQELPVLYAQEYAGPPDQPVGVEADEQPGHVLLQWNPTAGASSYSVYRASESESYDTDMPACIDYTNNSDELRTYSIRAVNAYGSSPPTTFSVEGPTSMSIMINCGGGKVEGNCTVGNVKTTTFEADRDYIGGKAANNYNGPITRWSNDYAPEQVNHTERWGDFEYVFPGLNPAATYRLKLYFSEEYKGVTGPGQRLFNVAVNQPDHVVLRHLDIWKEACGLWNVADGAHRAFVEDFSVSPDSKGSLSIIFHSITGEAKVDAIEVDPVDANGNGLDACSQ